MKTHTDPIIKKYIYDVVKSGDTELYVFSTIYDNFLLKIFEGNGAKIINIKRLRYDYKNYNEINRILYPHDVKNNYILDILFLTLHELIVSIDNRHELLHHISKVNIKNSIILQLILLILIEDERSSLLINNNKLIIDYNEEYIPTLNKIGALDRILNSEKKYD